MNSVKIYNTKQKSIVKNLFASNPEEHYTAEQLLSLLVENEKLLSKATLYRTLDALIESGEIIKYRIDGNVSCYHCNDCEKNYIHFRCNTCGTLLHIKNPIIDKMTNKLSNEYGVEIDNNRTVLYGTCQKCKEEK